MYQSVFKDGLFAGRVAVVTGGGSGIGRCTAHELAALGARVALVGRTPDKLATVAREIADAGGSASTHVCDIRDEDTVRSTITAILTAHGRIDALVNNAGGQFPGALRDISKKGWDAVVATNLTGGFLVARECVTQWMQKNGGAIVNMIADAWGGMPGMGHSGAARAGMLNFTETAALEWAAYGVRVNAVAPGYVASSGLDEYPAAMKPLIRQIPKTVPLQRFGTESEMAAAIVFLLTPAAAFITGAVLRIDGGRPNARNGWPLDAGRTTQPYDGFHLARAPRVLEDDA